MLVFWEHGYEATSIGDLTAAMGITPPSLYAAFGDKERLFLEAIERYVLSTGGLGLRAMNDEACPRRGMERLLETAAEELTRPCHPRGCMVVMAATNCSVAAERVQAALVRQREQAEQAIRDRLQRALDQGQLPAGTDVAALADFYGAVYRGMSMRAKDGATRESLLATAAMAMRSWPQDAPAG